MSLLTRIKEKFSSKKINKKYQLGLSKSKKSLEDKLNQIAKEYTEINEEFFDELEELLITFDIGPKLAFEMCESIKDEVKEHRVNDPKLIKELILDQMIMYYIGEGYSDTTLNIKDNRINVVLVVGVNGVGKTTSIAKIANKLINEKKKVLLIAGDTFRSGAIEQLNIWSKRLNCDIVLPKKYGQDPSSVIFEGIKKAKEENYDVVICDTAGRLQTKTNLMKELTKIKKTITSFIPEAPHETLLVIDGMTGQNGISQAKTFNESTKIDGIVLTKMDGTSKGGIVISIKEQFNIPVKLIGLGENIDDLQEFELDEFIGGLVGEING